MRDTEVDEYEAPIRAATVRERLSASRAEQRSLTVAALPGVLATLGYPQLAGTYRRRSLSCRTPTDRRVQTMRRVTSDILSGT